MHNLHMVLGVPICQLFIMYTRLVDFCMIKCYCIFTFCLYMLRKENIHIDIEKQMNGDFKLWHIVQKDKRNIIQIVYILP